MQQRLEMLYQRNMFPLAIELAQKSGLDNEQQSLIYRRFGDHLYQKADYDGAMVQYIRAIDTTEPSQVIRKVNNTLQYAINANFRSTLIHNVFIILFNIWSSFMTIEKQPPITRPFSSTAMQSSRISTSLKSLSSLLATSSSTSIRQSPCVDRVGTMNRQRT